MSADRNVLIEFIARDRTARVTNRLEKSLGNMTKIAAAATAAIGGIAAGLTVVGGIRAAITQEENLTRLELALARTGQAARMPEIVEFSKNLESLTGTSREAIQAQIGLATTFGLTTDQAQKTVQAAIDLSAATGKDLRTSVELLSKTFSGQVGRARYLGNEYANLTAEQLKNGEAVRLVAEQYAGTAQVLDNTLGGSLGSLRNALKGTAQDFATAFLSEDVTRAIQDFTAFVNAVRDGLNGLGDELKLSFDIREAVFTSISLIRTLVSMVSQSIQGIIFLNESIRRLFNMASSRTADDIRSQIQELERFRALQERLGTAFSRRQAADATRRVTALKEQLKEVEAAGGTVFERMAATVINIEEALGNAGDKLVDDLRDAFTQLDDHRRVTRDIVNNMNEAGKSSQKAADNVGFMFGGFAASLARFRQILADIKAAAVEVSKVVLTSFLNAVGAGTKAMRALLDEQMDLDKQKARLEAELETVMDIENVLGAEEAFRRRAEINRELVELEEERLAIAEKQDKAAREGAIDFIKQVGSSVIDMIAPGFGQFVGPIMDMLLDPEAFKLFLNGFLDAIPEVITEMAENMDEVALALMEGLLRASPRITQALMNATLTAARASITVQLEGARMAVSAIASGIQKFFSDFLREVSGVFGGIGEVFQPFVGAIQRLIDFVRGLTGGGGGGGTMRQIGQAARTIVSPISRVRLNTGGLVQGAGTGDTVPALLTPGELVIDRTTGPRLNKFMDEFQSGGRGDDRVVDLLERLIQAVTAPMEVSTAIQVDNNALGEAVLELSRRQVRTEV